MQVNNQSTISSSISSGTAPLTLKKGEVLQATVKEKLPNNEAILQIKGQEVKVNTTGSFPSNGRISIEVTDTDQSIPTVKQIPTNPNISPSSVTAGLNINPETKDTLKKAVDILTTNKVPISKQTVQQLATFLEKGTGTIDQRLETVAMMAKKGLEFTPVQLKSVHEALHGKTKTSDLLNEFKAEPGQAAKYSGKVLKETHSLEENIRNVLQSGNVSKALELSKNNQSKFVSQALQLQQLAGQKLLSAVQGTELSHTVKELLSKGESIQSILNLLKTQAGNQILAGMENAAKLEATAGMTLLKSLDAQGNGSPLDPIINALKKEPNIQKVFSLIQGIDTLSATQKERLENSLTKAVELADAGRELASRQELMGVLEQIKSESTTRMEAPRESYQLSDDFIATLPSQSKDFIVTKVTEKLSQMAIDFKDIKRDITRNLQTVQSLLDQQKQVAVTKAKPLLEATIKQLDNAILKSDMMLYTDMATEKKMLTASSQLAEAKKLLDKGDHTAASKIVHDIKNMVDKLMFKPADVRVQHFVSKQFLQLEPPSNPNLDLSMQAVRDVATGRQMLEHLRNLGLTYHSDQAHSLITKGQAHEGAENSLKNALLKLAQTNQEQALSQKAEQALTQITGQQLLSKTDSSSLQSMMFMIPFLLQDKAEQVKVFVNSKNDQQKVDWENCNLYFHIETKKLGDVGIMLSAVERTLSVTIKNDKPDFKDKIKPIAEKAKERLSDIGYNIGNIQFTSFVDEKVQTKKQEPKPAVPNFNERGYDFSV